ncbi:GTPase domain-containing protein [Geodermatophilus sp. SYSU D00766]
MPVPLLAVAALVAFGVLGATAAAVALWPGASKKSFLIMGPRLSGKTTLSEFLAHGVVPKEYVATGGTRRVEPTTRVHFGDLKLKIAIDKLWDPGGEADAIRAWHDKAKVADVLVYLINYAEAADEAYVTRVRRDTRQLRDWRRQDELKEGCRTVLVVTHMDQHELFRAQEGPTRAGDGEDAARTAPAVRAAVEEMGPTCTLTAGSLADELGCADIASRLLTALEAGPS